MEWYVSKNDLASLLGVSKRTITNWCQSGLRSYRLTHETVFFDPFECREWLESHPHAKIRSHAVKLSGFRLDKP